MLPLVDPPPNRFYCRLSRMSPEVALVRVIGEVDLETATPLRAVLMAALQTHPSVIADLTEVTFMDSTGLSTLVEAHRCATDNGGTVCLVGLTKPIRKLITITALDAIFPISKSLPDAASALDPQLTTLQANDKGRLP